MFTLGNFALIVLKGQPAQ